MDDWVLEIGKAMCRQWGINPNECSAIDISWRPYELPTATVELRLNEGVVQQLLTLAPITRPVPDD